MGVSKRTYLGEKTETMFARHMAQGQACGVQAADARTGIGQY